MRYAVLSLAVLLAGCPSPRAGGSAGGSKSGPAAADSAPVSADTSPPSADEPPPPAPAPPAAALEGTEWRLAEIGGQPSSTVLDSARYPRFTLLAKGHRLQGSAGCNRMSGSYELNGRSLKLGPLATTRMACPALETETAFLKALGATTRYEISGTRLTLFGGDTAVARLEAAGGAR